MPVATPSIKNIFVISALRGERTVHSALENYTNGFLGGFRNGGLNLEGIDLRAAELISLNTKGPLPLPLRIAKQIGTLGIAMEYIQGIMLAIKYFPLRRQTGVFHTNVSRIYLPMTIILRMMGFTIIYWIVDYYPNRATIVNRALRRYSHLNITINQYIANSIPQDTDQVVFQGATDSPSPAFLNLPQPGEPFRLLYAGKLNSLNCIDTIIDIVSRQPGKISLELYGDGEFEYLAREKATQFSNIEFHGHVPRDYILKRMQNMHGVLCLRRTDDDYYQGFFPSKLIEMLASPAHVFVSDMNDLTHSLKGAAVFVKGQGAENLLDAINIAQAMGPNELKLLVQRRSVLLRTEFNWARLTRIVKGARQDRG